MPQKILDFHVHIGNHEDGIAKQSIPQLLQSMKENNISHAVVFPYKEAAAAVEETSLRILEEAKSHPNLFPFLRFDPKATDAEKLQELLKKFYGIKLHPRAEDFNPLDKKFFPLYEIISSSGKPLLIHTRKEGLENTDPENMIKLADFFPDLTLVLAHFANNYPAVIERMKNLGNVYLDTSIYSSQSSVYFAAKKIGADRILFGSDATRSNQHTQLYDILYGWLSEEEKELVLFNNAARLLKLK